MGLRRVKIDTLDKGSGKTKQTLRRYYHGRHSITPPQYIYRVQSRGHDRHRLFRPDNKSEGCPEHEGSHQTPPPWCGDSPTLVPWKARLSTEVTWPGQRGHGSRGWSPGRAEAILLRRASSTTTRNGRGPEKGGRYDYVRLVRVRNRGALGR